MEFSFFKNRIELKKRIPLLKAAKERDEILARDGRFLKIKLERAPAIKRKMQIVNGFVLIDFGWLRGGHLDNKWSNANPKEEEMAFENLLFIIKNYWQHGYKNVIVTDLREDKVVTLAEIFKDKRPAISFTSRYPFLEEIKEQAIADAERKNKKPAAIMLIYDENMYDLATLWLFHRRLIYEGWPIVTSEFYLNQNQNYWRDQGVKEFYFVQIIDPEILQRPQEERSDHPQKLAEQLNSSPETIIKRPDGRPVFAVYHWQ